MLVPFDDTNQHIFNNLVQAYEAEFSSVTLKKADKNGLFELDSIPGGSIRGYFWYEEELPAGFILIDLQAKPTNVNEFYVLPCYRNKGVGEKFFYEVLLRHPGEWQVKQLLGATKAKLFWRKVIGKYTSSNFIEETYIDGYWGEVNRQLFKTR